MRAGNGNGKFFQQPPCRVLFYKTWSEKIRASMRKISHHEILFQLPTTQSFSHFSRPLLFLNDRHANPTDMLTWYHSNLGIWEILLWKYKKFQDPGVQKLIQRFKSMSFFSGCECRRPSLWLPVGSGCYTSTTLLSESFNPYLWKFLTVKKEAWQSSGFSTKRFLRILYFLTTRPVRGNWSVNFPIATNNDYNPY